MNKTNAMRLLDTSGIPYRAVEYSWEENDLGGQHVARETGMDPDQVFKRGGCSPIGMKKQYPTFIDETAILFDEIAVSGGARGLQMVLSPEELISYAGIISADLTE